LGWNKTKKHSKIKMGRKTKTTKKAKTGIYNIFM
jgi:hypothetical protein